MCLAGIYGVHHVFHQRCRAVYIHTRAGPTRELVPSLCRIPASSPFGSHLGGHPDLQPSQAQRVKVTVSLTALNVVVVISGVSSTQEVAALRDTLKRSILCAQK